MLTVLLDAPAAPAKTYPIARLGEFKDKRYGDFAITRTDFDEWGRKLDSVFGGRVPIDTDHGADRPGGSSRAAGWITGVQLARDEHGEYVEGKVEWTPYGEQLIKGQEYRYFSPSFVDNLRDEQGNALGKALLGAGLTNRPFLRRGMKPITLSDEAPDLAAPDEDERVIALFNPRQARGPDGKWIDVGFGSSYDPPSAPGWQNAPHDSGAATGGNFYPVPGGPGIPPMAVQRAASDGDKDAQNVLDALAAWWEKTTDDVLGSDDHFDRIKGSKTSGGWVGPHRSRLLDDDHSALRDSQVVSDFAKTLAKSLGLAEDSTEEQVAAKVAELSGEGAKTLDARAEEEGKIVLDGDTVRTLQANAEAGKLAADTLREQRFTLAYDAAFSRGAVDAKDETKETYRKVYDLDADTGVTLLESLPDGASFPTSPAGSGPGSGPRGGFDVPGADEITLRDGGDREGMVVLDEDRADLAVKALAAARERGELTVESFEAEIDKLTAGGQV